MADVAPTRIRPLAEKERKAHRAANRLLVGAGILLAEAGIPRHAPEMKAIAAALRAVNRAGAAPWPKSSSPREKETILAHPPSHARGFRKTAL